MIKTEKILIKTTGDSQRTNRCLQQKVKFESELSTVTSFELFVSSDKLNKSSEKHLLAISLSKGLKISFKVKETKPKLHVKYASKVTFQ